MRLRPPFAFALAGVCLLAVSFQADRVPLGDGRRPDAQVNTAASLIRRDVPVRAAAVNEPGPAPAVVATPAPPAPPAYEWLWPANGAVTSEFGPRWGRMHAGIDIDAPDGSDIVAPKAGVVVFSGWDSGYGNQVIIDHGNGFTTVYAHQRAIAVPLGTRVAQGQLLGWVGCSGSCTGGHLHFEIRINDVAQSPRLFLDGPLPAATPVLTTATQAATPAGARRAIGPR